MHKVQLKWLGTSYRYAAATGAYRRGNAASPPWQRPRRGSGPVPQWPEAMGSKWTSTHQKNNEKYRNIMKHHLKYSKIELVKLGGYSESYSIYFMMGIVRTCPYSTIFNSHISRRFPRTNTVRRNSKAIPPSPPFSQQSSPHTSARLESGIVWGQGTHMFQRLSPPLPL